MERITKILGFLSFKTQLASELLFSLSPNTNGELNKNNLREHTLNFPEQKKDTMKTKTKGREKITNKNNCDNYLPSGQLNHLSNNLIVHCHSDSQSK